MRGEYSRVMDDFVERSRLVFLKTSRILTFALRVSTTVISLTTVQLRLERKLEKTPRADP